MTLQKKARFTGFLFLFFIAVSILHYSIIEVHLVPTERTVDVIDFIRQNDLLFRSGIVIDLILFSSGIVLSMALYSLLKTAHRDIAFLAMAWIIIETAITVVIEISSFAALLIANSGVYEPDILFRLVLELRFMGYRIVLLFFNLGFIGFFYLFYKTRYIPRLLSGFAMFVLSILMLINFAGILIPHESIAILVQIFASLVMLSQLATGIWLLVRGAQKEPAHS